MGLKDIKDFSAEEVGLWLTVQGLGAKAEAFIEEGVDGDLLLDLTEEELKHDLGLSGIQTKKLMKNIAFCRELMEEADGGGAEKEVSELENKIKTLSTENDTLDDKIEALEAEIAGKNAEIEELKRKIEASQEKDIPVVQGTVVSETAPEPKASHAPAHHAPAPTPPPVHKSQHKQRGQVIRGAAGGAAGGAIKGAVREFVFILYYVTFNIT